MIRTAVTPPRTASFGSWTDPQLIEACLGGDPQAWNELVDRYGCLVYSVPRRNGLSDADCDDVFQDVFTILYRKLDTIRDRHRLSAWLFRTTHRESIRVSKQNGRYVELDGTVSSEADAVEEEVGALERQQLVRQALRQLGPPCQPLLMALFSNCAGSSPNYNGIADRLGIKRGSIGPTRARCFKKLQRILAELGFEPDTIASSAAAAGATGFADSARI